MQHPKTVLILFECELALLTDQKTRSTLRRKTAASCVHKGTSGFFLAYEDGFVGVFEGKTNKVFSQIEGLIRKPFVTQLNVVQEFHPSERIWDTWFQGGRMLSDLPRGEMDRLPGLAQFVLHKLNAG